MKRPATRERSNDPGLLILISLLGGAKHGYLLTQDIEDFAGVTLGPGTLYGAITRLESRALIEPADEGVESRRRPYRLTSEGAEVVDVALRDMRTLVDAATTRQRRRAAH